MAPGHIHRNNNKTRGVYFCHYIFFLSIEIYTISSYTIPLYNVFSHYIPAYIDYFLIAHPDAAHHPYDLPTPTPTPTPSPTSPTTYQRQNITFQLPPFRV